MKTIRQALPSPFTAFKALLRADTIVQFRQRRSIIMSVLLPSFFLIPMKRSIPTLGPVNVLAACIAIGLPAIGLMGYSLIVARDRERGVFQRIRTTPTATWVIMSSRILVQIAIMVFVTALVIIAAYSIAGIQTSIGSALLAMVAVILCGAVFLALGQLIVALVTSSETVNAATRFIYTAIIFVGVFGAAAKSSNPWHNIAEWSPMGVTKTIIAQALSPHTPESHVLLSALVALGYTLVFATIGIRWFKWTVA
jgi:ABC-2 type transport system permease protein